MKLKKLLKIIVSTDTVVITGESRTLYYGAAKSVPARLFDYKVSLVYSALDNIPKTVSIIGIIVKGED